MTMKMLSQADLAALVAGQIAAGTTVIAPVRSQEKPEKADYRAIRSFEEAALGMLPRRSLKEFLLPATDVLMRYTQHKGEVTIDETPIAPPKQLLLGGKPCDAAGVEVLDKVMDWDYRDDFWFARREATTVVSLLCPGMDASCFCSAVGIGPDSVIGSDLLLLPVEGGYLAQIVTEKGDAFLAGRATEVTDQGLLTQAEEQRQASRAKIEQNLPVVPKEMADWLARNFGHEYWETVALRCHGCGACASLCPTCHCFDIVDERDGVAGGVRRRNWDTCQSGKFTVHTSGHNPRETQSERIRQRVMHKFSIYPIRFGELLCTGCGRCARICPAGMNLTEIMGHLMAHAGDAPGGSEE